MNSTNIDLIIRIKNGYMAEKKAVDAVYSKLNENILNILKENRYITGYSIHEDAGKKSITVDLLFDGREPAVKDVKLFSRPGRREYRSVDELKPVLGGLGMSVLSTSKGVMSDAQAREAKIGGELLFSIW